MRLKPFYIAVLLLCVFTSYAQSNDPVVGFGKYYYVRTNGKWEMPLVTTADILSNPEMTVNRSDYRVTSFDFSMKPTQNDYIGPINVKGSKCNGEVLQMLKTYSGEGGVIYLENIKVLGPDKRQRSYMSIVMKYKN